MQSTWRPAVPTCKSSATGTGCLRNTVTAEQLRAPSCATTWQALPIANAVSRIEPSACSDRIRHPAGNPAAHRKVATAIGKDDRRLFHVHSRMPRPFSPKRKMNCPKIRVQSAIFLNSIFFARYSRRCCSECEIFSNSVTV